MMDDKVVTLYTCHSESNARTDFLHGVHSCAGTEIITDTLYWSGSMTTMLATLFELCAEPGT